MSRIATDWAWSLNLPSSQKLLLLSLADRADEQHCCYPSIQRLVSDTGLERKTIGKGINQMIEEGLIRDTGERKGPTKRVRVLQLNIGSKFTQKRNDTENGNVTKNGTLNDPKIGTLNDPKIGTQNQSLEPNIEPKTPLPPNGGISPGSAEESQDPKPEQPARQDYQAVLEVYNGAVADRLPHAVELNDKRRRGIKRLIGQLARKDIEGFRAYVAAFITNAPPFYFGDNDRGWTANLDYLLRADTLTKVREGTL